MIQLVGMAGVDIEPFLYMAYLNTLLVVANKS